MLDDSLYEQVNRLSNHQVVIKATESNITKSEDVPMWATKRTLNALALIMNEWESEGRLE